MSNLDIQSLLRLPADKRYTYLIQQVIEHEKIWILKGGSGSVLVGYDGQKSVPVWPHKSAAKMHINGDWSDCSCHAISLGDWQSRWTSGLTEDGLSLVVFMDDNEEGIIVSPEEFDDDLYMAMQAE